VLFVVRNLNLEGRKPFAARLVVFSLALLLVFFGNFPIPANQEALADKLLPENPVEVMVGHLSSDPVAGRIDYVFRTKTSSTNIVRAYAPGGQALFTISPGIDIQELQQFANGCD
jgi:hypothetical protein